MEQQLQLSLHRRHLVLAGAPHVAKEEVVTMARFQLELWHLDR